MQMIEFQAIFSKLIMRCAKNHLQLPYRHTLMEEAENKSEQEITLILKIIPRSCE